MKSKAQTDEEILEGAAKDNDEQDQIRIRNSENVHPVDCSCDLCIRTRFEKESPEKVLKELDWDVS